MAGTEGKFTLRMVGTAWVNEEKKKSGTKETTGKMQKMDNE